MRINPHLSHPELPALSRDEDLVVAGLPRREFTRLWHVGTLSKTGEQSYASHEGQLLSVSCHPEAWIRIARLGGLPTWELAGPFSLYDRLAFTSAQRTALTAMALERGLLVSRTAWRAWSYDAESDECEGCPECAECGADDGRRYSLYAGRAEAEANADENEHGDPEVEEVLAYQADERLFGWWHMRLSQKPDPDRPWLGAEEAAWCLLLDRLGCAAGIWWDERLQPEALSAPRGGIFQKHLAQIAVRQVRDGREKERL